MKSQKETVCKLRSHFEKNSKHNFLPAKEIKGVKCRQKIEFLRNINLMQEVWKSTSNVKNDR